MTILEYLTKDIGMTQAQMESIMKLANICGLVPMFENGFDLSDFDFVEYDEEQSEKQRIEEEKRRAASRQNASSPIARSFTFDEDSPYYSEVNLHNLYEKNDDTSWDRLIDNDDEVQSGTNVDNYDPPNRTIEDVNEFKFHDMPTTDTITIDTSENVTEEKRSLHYFIKQLYKIAQESTDDLNKLLYCVDAVVDKYSNGDVETVTDDDDDDDGANQLSGQTTQEDATDNELEAQPEESAIANDEHYANKIYDTGDLDDDSRSTIEIVEGLVNSAIKSLQYMPSNEAEKCRESLENPSDKTLLSLNDFIAKYPSNPFNKPLALLNQTSNDQSIDSLVNTAIGNNKADGGRTTGSAKTYFKNRVKDTLKNIQSRKRNNTFMEAISDQDDEYMEHPFTPPVNPSHGWNGRTIDRTYEGMMTNDAYDNDDALTKEQELVVRIIKGLGELSTADSLMIRRMMMNAALVMQDKYYSHEQTPADQLPDGYNGYDFDEDRSMDDINEMISDLIVDVNRRTNLSAAERVKLNKVQKLIDTFISEYPWSDFTDTFRDFGGFMRNLKHL